MDDPFENENIDNIKDTKTRLIIYGLKYMSENGADNISLRRIATECGVSCAAPYKHFKNKDDFIAEVIEYIVGMWMKIALEIKEKYPDDERTQIVEICMTYIDFLVKYSYFRSVLMVRIDKLRENNDISQVSKSVVKSYIDKYTIDDKTIEERTLLIRSIIYGAALMIDNGQLEYNAAARKILRRLIDNAVVKGICDKR